MQFFAIIFIVLSFGGLSLAAECPKIVTQKDFDVKKYAGLWYEAYRNTVIFQIGSICVNATYTPNPDGSFGVWNQAIDTLTGYTGIHGTARVKNASEPAAFDVTFNPVGGQDYNVITTNYVDYALLYTCYTIPSVELKFEYIWVLSRKKTMSPTVVNEVKKVLSNMGVDANSLIPTAQNC